MPLASHTKRSAGSSRSQSPAPHSWPTSTASPFDGATDEQVVCQSPRPPYLKGPEMTAINEREYELRTSTEPTSD